MHIIYWSKPDNVAAKMPFNGVLFSDKKFFLLFIIVEIFPTPFKSQVRIFKQISGGNCVHT